MLTDTSVLLAVQCPQHGSGLNVFDVIKDNIEVQTAQVLKADIVTWSTSSGHHRSTQCQTIYNTMPVSEPLVADMGSV